MRFFEVNYEFEEIFDLLDLYHNEYESFKYDGEGNFFGFTSMLDIYENLCDSDDSLFLGQISYLEKWQETNRIQESIDKIRKTIIEMVDPNGKSLTIKYVYLFENEIEFSQNLAVLLTYYTSSMECFYYKEYTYMFYYENALYVYIKSPKE